MDMDALKRDLDGLKIEDNAKLVQQKSRDFYWYSPVLKRQLDAVTADLVVTPRTEAEVVRVLAACHRHGVPVTPRGSGTGNYGQAMPLSGGIASKNTLNASSAPAEAPMPTIGKAEGFCPSLGRRSGCTAGSVFSGAAAGSAGCFFFAMVVLLRLMSANGTRQTGVKFAKTGHG